MSHLAPEACWDAFTDAQRSLVAWTKGISTADIGAARSAGTQLRAILARSDADTGL